MTAPAADRTTYVLQGDYRVTDDPREVLSTVLGSCVSVCLWDPQAGIGGMNHFLLPSARDAGRKSVRYGAHAMEVLVNALLKRGARRSGLQAKLFGGARMQAGLNDIGRANADFARTYLATEEIPCLAESLGGTMARRVVFRPVTGEARLLMVPNATLVETNVPRTPAPVGAPDITLF